MSGPATGAVTIGNRHCRPRNRSVRLHLRVEKCPGYGVLQVSAELRTHEVTDAVIWCFVTSREALADPREQFAEG